MNEEKRLERGARAQQLLNDPLIAEAFELVRQGIVDRWSQAPVRDRDGAHELKLMLKLLGDVHAALNQAVNDGKVVQFNQKQRLMDKVRGALGAHS